MTESSPPDQPWSWDPSLYAGSALHYAAGRVAYPAELVAALVEALGLDGSGTLVDVGCGPGSLTLLLAPHVRAAIGVDADPDMLVVADRLATAGGIGNVSWRHLRAEELPADLPPVDVATLAQSFHWMDQPRVAAILRRMLRPDGALVHIHATTHWGAAATAADTGWTSREMSPDHTDPAVVAVDAGGAAPPWRAVQNLVATYLGPRRRAGQRTRSAGPDDEDTSYRAAGFGDPRRYAVAGRAVERSADEVFAAVHSLSWAAPHLFGDRLGAFDAELRRLLEAASVDGRFREQMGSIAFDVWR